METRGERARRMGQLLAKARYDAGFTQQNMSLEMGIAMKTIHNWESGASSPTLFQALEWFRTLSLNPTPYFLRFIYPELYEKEVGSVDEKLKVAISQLSDSEKEQVLYILSGNHGSSIHALIQLTLAHIQTSLRSRCASAAIVLQSYQFEKRLGMLVAPDEPQPNIEVLRKAIQDGTESVYRNERSYVKGADDGES